MRTINPFYIMRKSPKETVVATPGGYIIADGAFPVEKKKAVELLEEITEIMNTKKPGKIYRAVRLSTGEVRDVKPTIREFEVVVGKEKFEVAVDSRNRIITIKGSGYVFSPYDPEMWPVWQYVVRTALNRDDYGIIYKNPMKARHADWESVSLINREKKILGKYVVMDNKMINPWIQRLKDFNKAVHYDGLPELPDGWRYLDAPGAFVGITSSDGRIAMVPVHELRKFGLEVFEEYAVPFDYVDSDGGRYRLVDKRFVEYCWGARCIKADMLTETLHDVRWRTYEKSVKRRPPTPEDVEKLVKIARNPEKLRKILEKIMKK